MNHTPRTGRGFGMDFVADPQSTRSEEALAELLLAARRQFWVMVAGVCIGVAGAVFHYATSPKVFVASASLLIEEQRAELEQELSAALPTSRNDTSMMNEMQILASLQVATDVAAALDLTGNETFQNPPSSLLSQWLSDAKGAVRALIPQPEPVSVASGQENAQDAADRALMQTAQRLRSSTDFNRVGRSFVVEIWFASADPALAADIVNTYAEAYIADGIRATVSSAEQRAAWMDSRLQDLRAEAQAAAEAAEQFRRDVGVADQQGLRELEQQAEALNDLVFTFQNRYRELALESSFPVSSGRILSRAMPPRDPSAPSAVQLLAGGVLLGLLLGLTGAVLREARETGFRTASDVTRALGLPFLGYVPRDGGAFAPRALRRAWTAGPVHRLAKGTGRRATKAGTGARKVLPSRHLADPEDGLPPAGFPFAATTENEGVRSTAFTHSMRGVFAALDPARTDGVGRRIAVGALTPGEDSAAIALELARQAVSSGRRCLLVDADFTTAELTRRLRLTDAPGTMHVLDGTTGLGAALCGSFADDLDVLPVGESAEAAPPIAYMAEFAELIADLSDGYDDVVIALPPLLDAPEARGLLRQADSTILVVAWGQTSRRLVRSCLDHDPMLRVQGTAVVLSRVNLRKLARYGVTRSGRTRRQSGRAWAKTP